MDNNLPNESTTLHGPIAEDDPHLKIEKLLALVTELESQKVISEKQFGQQRAKMKDRLLKEEEIRRDLESELASLRKDLEHTKVKLEEATINLEVDKNEAQAKIDTLQELLNETLEEGSKNRNKITELEFQLKHHSTQSSDSMLTVPTTMVRSLARKVVSQFGNDEPQVENLEESMKKVNKYAKEDTEVLRSLVLPLEEELASVKDKLRETDAELRRYKDFEERKLTEKNSDSLINLNSPMDGPDGSTSSLVKPLVCDMCVNYEAQLVQAQAKLSEIDKLSASLERYKEELEKESIFRKQMENKWSECKEEHKIKVVELQQKMKGAEDALNELRAHFEGVYSRIYREFNELKEKRSLTEKNLKAIQAENDRLVGKYNAHSMKLHDENINLPDDVQTLQEMWLRQREELIQARVGLETSEDSNKSLTAYLSKLEAEKSDSEMERAKHLSTIEEINQQLKLKCEAEKNNIRRIESLEASMSSIGDEKKKLEKSEGELKSKLLSLQAGLEDGEAVQKDFVRLLQSLQKELVRLKGQGNILMWEHEEDVSECRGCELPFKNRGKHNCKHCGRVFCTPCLKYKVFSGPNQRESRVCEVCNTLIIQASPPHLLEEPPDQ